MANGSEQNLTKKERYELRRAAKQERYDYKARNRLVKRIALWSFVALGIGGIVFGVIKLGGNPSSQEKALLVDAVADSDWTKGTGDAEVILVEYSDFQCPACKNYYPIVKQLTEEFADTVQFVYRHFPLYSIHKNAEEAAWAAEAAGRQGKFWEMHDLIFENQDEWSKEGNVKETFVSYARDLGLNKEKFLADFESEEVQNKVTRDYQSGIASRVNSTPTFFLNGERIQNPRSYEEFRALIGGNP